MVEVFREVRRVTRPDGVLWLNLGDSYASTNPRHNHNGSGSLTGSNLKNKELSAPNEFIPLPEGYKAKDLMGIPWRVAFALQADGWYFRSAIPWIKRNCMPESTTDRPTSAIEYIFLMAKSAKYYYDGEAIRCPSVTGPDNRSERADSRRDVPGANRISGKKKQDQTGNPTYTGFNERWKGKHSTQDPQSAGVRIGINSKKAREETGSHDGMFGATRNYRNSDPFFESWQGLYSESEKPLAFVINPQARPELHFATFPDLLAETCIKAGTSEYGCCPKCGKPWERAVEPTPEYAAVLGRKIRSNDMETLGLTRGTGNPSISASYITKGWKPGCKCGESERVPCLVLDPFMGSGTVAVVARELNRSSIGCELNPKYVKIIRARLNADSQLDTGVVSYRFEKVPA